MIIGQFPCPIIKNNTKEERGMTVLNFNES